MQRTTVVIPATLKNRATRLAAKRGVTFGELVRASLQLMLKRESSGESDPLFDDRAIFRGPAPVDLSEAHDRYLYEGS